MKKNLVRIVALLLVAMLALTLIPLGALAAGVTVYVDNAGSEKNSPTANDLYYLGSEKNQTGTTSVTIKTSNYDKYIIGADGKDYDLKGIVDGDKAFSNPDKKLDPKSSVTFKSDGWAILIYTPHNHKLSHWISDGTTHWRNCLVCDEDFMYQTWCVDGDEDGTCNVCGGHVPYHDVTVIDSEGGKITVNRDNASHRMKITADVEPAAGYSLKKLHFTKVRDDGSKQEITRYQNGQDFWTYMPTYDLEITAEFTKK